jgi:hypothetical protein
VDLERGPLRLVSTTEELLGRNSSGSGLENGDYGCGTLYPQKLAPTSCSRSIGIVRWRTQATEFFVFVFGALFQTRGLTCSLQLLLVLASAVTFGSQSRGTHDSGTRLTQTCTRAGPRACKMQLFLLLVSLHGLRRKQNTFFCCSICLAYRYHDLFDCYVLSH